MAAPLGRVPIALTLHHLSSLESLVCLEGTACGSDRCDTLHPLAPGKNASNILLMWWRLARRLQLSPWESSVVNRLLTPTHSFLARSKSTAALSGDTGKTVKVKLCWWGKALLLKPLWASSIHLITSPFFPTCASVSSGWTGFGNVCWCWFHAPGIVSSEHLIWTPDARQTKDAPPCDHGLLILLCVHESSRKTYPFPTFLSAPAAKLMIGGRNNLIQQYVYLGVKPKRKPI